MFPSFLTFDKLRADGNELRILGARGTLTTGDAFQTFRAGRGEARPRWFDLPASRRSFSSERDSRNSRNSAPGAGASW
jgi:hypothetical protein